jgi:hypothetical protein
MNTYVDGEKVKLVSTGEKATVCLVQENVLGLIMENGEFAIVTYFDVTKSEAE